MLPWVNDINDSINRTVNRWTLTEAQMDLLEWNIFRFQFRLAMDFDWGIRSFLLVFLVSKCNESILLKEISFPINFMIKNKQTDEPLCDGNIQNLLVVYRQYSPCVFSQTLLYLSIFLDHSTIFVWRSSWPRLFLQHLRLLNRRVLLRYRCHCKLWKRKWEWNRDNQNWQREIAFDFQRKFTIKQKKTKKLYRRILWKTDQCFHFFLCFTVGGRKCNRD